MDYRNPVYTATGSIDCEVQHPVFGWIPYTAAPDDVAPSGRALYETITEAGGVAAYVKGPDPVPTMATKLALYEQLHQSGDWPDIATALAADEHAGNVWQFASIIERSHPMIEQFRLLLGWTVQQVDDLFRAAQ